MTERTEHTQQLTRSQRAEQPTRRWKRSALTAGLTLAAATSVACGTESGSCGGTGQLEGQYFSASPAMSMDLLECDGEVTGTLTYAGRDYQLEGTVAEGVFGWSTDGEDYCATTGVRRFLNSSRPGFAVDPDADGFTGDLRIRDASCTSGRAFVRGSGNVRFDRR